jgi:pyruvate kinase
LNDFYFANYVLQHGIEAHFMKYEQIDEAIEESIRQLKELNIVKVDDTLVHVGSMPLHLHGQTNMLKVSMV